MEELYFCIDYKSFYASVECAEAGLDPFEVPLVVADPSKGEGAITLAATPAIKKYGVKSRGRIYEIPKHLHYIIAKPRMRLYMEYSVRIYQILLQFIAEEDIYVYSIDESFLYIKPYLNFYRMQAKEFAQMLCKEIYKRTKITATVGIGSNLYLSKIALDISAKHTKENIAYLNEMLYQQQLWKHQPLSDFWRIGEQMQKKLNKHGIFTMYDIAHANPDHIYQLFGVQAQYIIEHAWGKEFLTLKEIKEYQPESKSISSSQILTEDYTYSQAYLVMKEMIELTLLDMVEQYLVSNHIGLYIAYSKEQLPAKHISCKVSYCSNSYHLFIRDFCHLYRTNIDKKTPIRKVGIAFHNVKSQSQEYYNLFIDENKIKEERKVQHAILAIHKKYGKNAALKGMNLLEKATTRRRNTQIGGHNA